MAENPVPVVGLEASMLAQAIDMSVDAIVIVNIRGIITMANASAGAMFGYVLSQLIGMTVEELMPERFRHHHRGHRQLFTNSPSIRPMGENIDLYALKSNGHEFSIEVGLRPVTYGGQQCTLAVMRNMNVPKAIEGRFVEISTQLALLSNTMAEREEVWQRLRAPIAVQVETLERRLDKIEADHEKDRELLASVHNMLEHLTHFAQWVTKSARILGGAVTTAVVIAVVVALILRYLHLNPIK